ncbi:hypothetical protein [Kitasatospora cystarginea]
MTGPAYPPEATVLDSATRAMEVANECQLPVALLASADTRCNGANVVDLTGPAFTACGYEDGSHTEVHRLPAATVRCESRRNRFTQAVLAATLPNGQVDSDAYSVFVRGRLQDATVSADGTWRAFATVVNGSWLVLAVVPDPAGKGTAPNLRLIHPTAPAGAQEKGAV